MARGNRNGNTGSSGSDAAVSDGTFIDPRDIERGDSGTGEEVSVSADEASIGSSPQRRRRGRKPGAAKTASLDLKGIEHILYSSHLMLAAALKVPEMQLSQAEAQGMALAMQNVARHYPTVQATQQTLDWIALIMCCATVYGSRVGQYKARMRAQRAPRSGASPIVNFPVSPTVGPSGNA